MRIFTSVDAAAPDTGRGVGLGFFDGVHCGHQELLRTLAYTCHALQLKPAVFTFSLHPSELLGNGDFPGYTACRSDRLRKISECGIEETYLQPFDENFSRLSPLEFLDKVLLAKMNAQLIVAGSDYRFGYRGQGDIEMLARWAEAHSIRLEIVSQVSLEGEKVSSTRIRNLIREGRVDLAGRLLGEGFKIRGPVISGRGLGHKLGFPTTNQTLPPSLVCPAYGVYATRTTVDNRTYDSVTNVGLRPTVDPDNRVPLIETYLYGTDQSLYGQEITVEFLQMMRPELSFSSLDDLQREIAQDLEQVGKWHHDCEQLNRLAVINNIPLYWLPTRRFSRAVLYLIFSCPVEKKLYTGLTLLSRILTSCCRKLPSRAQLSAELNSLYGSSIDAHVEKKGDLQLVVFSVESLMSWTDGSSPFASSCRLLFDMLLDPLLDENGFFPETIVETERQNLLLEHLSRENDRTRYAYDRFIELLCGSRPHAVLPLGDRVELTKISREDLREILHMLRHELQITCLAAGSPDNGAIGECLAGLDRMPRTVRPEYLPGVMPAPAGTFNRFEQQEEKKIQQSRIIMAYDGLPPYFSFQSITASVLNNMLGGDVHSLLFDEVREKNGMAYSVYSLYQRYLSLLVVIAGVNPLQSEEAAKLIRFQVGRLGSGDFPEQLLQRSKSMIRSSILAVDDDIGSMLEHQVNGLFHGRRLGKEDLLALLNAVDRRAIVEMAGKLEPLARYTLQGRLENQPVQIKEEQDAGNHG